MRPYWEAATMSGMQIFDLTVFAVTWLIGMAGGFHLMRQHRAGPLSVALMAMSVFASWGLIALTYGNETMRGIAFFLVAVAGFFSIFQVMNERDRRAAARKIEAARPAIDFKAADLYDADKDPTAAHLSADQREHRAIFLQGTIYGYLRPVAIFGEGYPSQVEHVQNCPKAKSDGLLAMAIKEGWVEDPRPADDADRMLDEYVADVVVPKAPGFKELQAQCERCFEARLHDGAGEASVRLCERHKHLWQKYADYLDNGDLMSAGGVSMVMRRDIRA